MDAPALPSEKNPAHPVRRSVVRILRTLALAFAAILGLCMIFENRLIYFPSREAVGPSPGEEVWLTTADGVKIHGWYLPHPKARATILHFHGNAGNLEHRRELVRGLHDLGANVMAIDFRGYGKSEGSPDERGVYADARAAYDWLLTKTTPDKIVLHGESLGGGPACEIAATVPVGGLIVQSAFTSARDMAPRVLPFFPKWLVRTRYDNLEKVARIRCRKLFMHGREDEIVPFDMGEQLFAGAAEPKECEWFSMAGHNDVWVSQPRKYYSRVAKFLEPFGT